MKKILITLSICIIIFAFIGLLSLIATTSNLDFTIILLVFVLSMFLIVARFSMLKDNRKLLKATIINLIINLVLVVLFAVYYYINIWLPANPPVPTICVKAPDSVACYFYSYSNPRSNDISIFCDEYYKYLSPAYGKTLTKEEAVMNMKADNVEYPGRVGDPNKLSVIFEAEEYSNSPTIENAVKFCINESDGGYQPVGFMKYETSTSTDSKFVNVSIAILLVVASSTYTTLFFGLLWFIELIKMIFRRRAG